MLLSESFISFPIHATQRSNPDRIHKSKSARTMSSSNDKKKQMHDLGAPSLLDSTSDSRYPSEAIPASALEKLKKASPTMGSASKHAPISPFSTASRAAKEQMRTLQPWDTNDSRYPPEALPHPSATKDSNADTRCAKSDEREAEKRRQPHSSGVHSQSQKPSDNLQKSYSTRGA